jgi:hypothetical protein
MQAPILHGGCLCGSVKYVVKNPKPQGVVNEHEEAILKTCVVAESEGNAEGGWKWAVSHCFCQACRLSSGALFQTWNQIPQTYLTIESGESDIAVFESTPDQHWRSFCSRCSTPLFWRSKDEPDTQGITTASLDKNDVAKFTKLVKICRIDETFDKDGGFVDLEKWKHHVPYEDNNHEKREQVDLGVASKEVNKVKGTCLCGAVTFTLGFPPPSPTNATKLEVDYGSIKDENEVYRWNVHHCHCDTCRLYGGALFQSFLSTCISRMTIPEGVQVSGHPSSDRFIRMFCPQCFTAVWLDDTKYSDAKHIIFGTLSNNEVAKEWVKFTRRAFMKSVIKGSLAEMSEWEDKAVRCPEYLPVKE